MVLSFSEPDYQILNTGLKERVIKANRYSKSIQATSIKKTEAHFLFPK